MLSGNNLFKSTSHCGSNLTNYVSLRWKTKPGKPFWLGIAKTKMFVIPERKVDPPEEAAEVMRLRSIYDRQMTSLHNFMVTNLNQHCEMEKNTTVADSKTKAKLLHERWNAESARLREERLNKEEEERFERILNEVTERKNKLKDIHLKVEKIVQKEIEICETYITEKNLDEAIEKCLANVSDYNYALDLSGNIYKGESMTPTGKIKPVTSTEIEEMITTSSSSIESEISTKT